MLASTTLNLGSLYASVINCSTHNSQKPLNFSTPYSQKHTQQQALPLPYHLASPNSTTHGWGTNTSVRTAVAAVDYSNPPEKELTRNKKYHFVIANAKFMLDEEEHFKELLFERLRNYGERNKEHDFWLVIEPKFLNKFPNITQRLNRPAVALVSTNGPWITFMKLRLDRVLQESYDADSLEEALAANHINLEFDRPEKWVAPYPKYEYGWWEPFLSPGSKIPKA